MQLQLSKWFQKLLIVNDSVVDDQFTLTDGESSNEDGSASSSQDEVRSGVAAASRLTSGGGSIRPKSLRDFLKQGRQEYDVSAKQHVPGQPHGIPVDLDETKLLLQKTFHLDINKDVVVRDFIIGTEHPWRAMAVFVDGMADKTTINTHVLQPLMILTHIPGDEPRRHMETIAEQLLPGNQVTLMQQWGDVVPAILAGSTAVFVDHCDAAILVETKGWEHRTVGPVQTENVVRGPHNGFTESFRANTALVRSLLRTPHLVTDIIEVGTLAPTDVAIMWIEGLTNKSLVEETKRRIQAIEVDYLPDSGLLEQFLDDKPSMMIPQVFSTERPDRIASLLSEGHVAIFVGNSTFVLAVPVVFWTLVHTAEDAYLRFPFGSFLRVLRWIALVVALLLPAMYVAITNYHPEMIPTDLMLAIAGSREQVPFPVVVEILLMEFAIELIREAGIRIPSIIGPTIGIVGALIIGQAAVQAGIVSPLLVIVVATTALASFTIPNYHLNLAVRVSRFFFLIAAAFLGFYGIAILAVVYLVRLSVQKSFGVPLLAPVTPSMRSSPDVLMRGYVFQMNQRPEYLQTQKKWRQSPVTRPWSKDTRPVPQSDQEETGGSTVHADSVRGERRDRP
ncbi:MAG: spore germination protein [Alicyclobacillaceae bacterium]|nr:spore germination protein [Alicyclobacillaceae bacterium]